MKTSRFLTLVVSLAILAAPGRALLKVVASTSDLAEFARAVGGDRVTVDYIVRGDQNPHLVEVKPSYMMKLKAADLFLEIGMQLEIWAPQIIDGSRNARLQVIDCSRDIHKMEVPTAKVDASQGDVHPFGNPHYWLDPENVRVILDEIADSFGERDPADAAYFRANADRYWTSLARSIANWRQLMAPYRGRKLVTYHSSFSYFAHRFGLEVAGYVEPKPGIAPTPSHVVALEQQMRQDRIGVVGVEQYYEESTPNAIADAVGARVIRLCTSVGGREGLETYTDMMDANVRALAGAFAAQQ